MNSCYILSEYGYYSKINLKNGADISELKYNNKDILVPYDSVKSKENFFLHGSPMLLPANRTVNGKFLFENTEYQLPINEASSNCHLHGFLYNRPFKLVSSSPTELVAEYINNCEIFPFEFRITVKYAITEKGFSSNYIIKNLSEKSMPLVFGLHTAFPEPEHFRVPLLECQERDEMCIPTGRYMPLNSNQIMFSKGTFPKGNNVYGYYKSGGNEAVIGDFKYTVSSDFTHWILYNGNGNGGFLCVEPQCGEVNGLNGSCKVIPPKSEAKFSTLISR